MVLTEIKWDAGIVVAIVGAGATVLGAGMTGFWVWIQGKRKGDAEASKLEVDASVNANAQLMNGFILLINEFKAEREMFRDRIEVLESDNRRCGARINQLEASMIRANIRIPAEPKFRLVGQGEGT